MRKSLAATVWPAGIIAFASSVAAATLTPVNPYPGSVQTTVFGINDSNVIAGSYVDSTGIEHGFFGPLNGTYTSFDYGGDSTGTSARGINDEGYIVGDAPNPESTVGAEFLRYPTGKILTIRKDGRPLDGVAQGIARRVNSVGDYFVPASGQFNGYSARRGKYVSDVTLGFSVLRTSPRAVNRKGAIAGWFTDKAGLDHGFVLADGVVKIVDFHNGSATMLEGLNATVCSAGNYTDKNGVVHAFVYDGRKGKILPIDVPGSSSQQAWGVNDNGLVAVSTDIGSFILGNIKPGKHQCPSGGTNADTSVRTAAAFLLQQRAHSIAAHPTVPVKRPKESAPP